MKYSDKLIKIISDNKAKHHYKFYNKMVNTTFNGINKKDYVLIAGLPATGKRSFVDAFYVLDILRQWNKLEKKERELEPLKILYFSTKYPEGTKLMKWASYLYTKKTNRIMDIPTLTNVDGKLFTINENREEHVLKNFKLIEDATEEGVLEIIDSGITPSSIDIKLNGLMNEMGDIEYNENGDAIFIPNEGFERGLTIVVIDDINNIKSSNSNYGEGKMNNQEMTIVLNKMFKKYSSLGLAIVAVHTTDAANQGFKLYSPSFRELRGFSPNKAIIMFNPFQESYKTHLQFETLDYVDKHNINRLRFAYVVYNEFGKSNVHLPLLFMPENGIFGALKFIENDEEIDYNMRQFDKFVKIRKTF